MKKLILAAIAMGLGASLHAQGLVVFVNSSSQLIYTNTISIGGSSGKAATTASGSGIKLALYWGILGSSENQLIQIGPTAGVSPLPGRVNAGIYTTGTATAPGAYATFQVRGWTGEYSTYEAAYYAATQGGDSEVLIGWSALFNSDTGSTAVPPEPPQPLDTMPSFELKPVPEPTTCALLGIGLLGLLWKPVRRMTSK